MAHSGTTKSVHVLSVDQREDIVRLISEPEILAIDETVLGFQSTLKVIHQIE
jgi:hypothetical protein